MADKDLSRIRRQFDAIGRFAPPSRRIFDPLLQKGMHWVRLPIALLLILGGIFSFLPLFGLWMLPLGFLLLAVDIPLLRRSVAAGSIWARRKGRRLTRRGRSSLERR